MLNKAEKKVLSLMRRDLRHSNLQYPTRLVEVPQEQWPSFAVEEAAMPSRVFRSRHYLVQAFEDTIPFRLSIGIADLDSEGRWKDGLLWDDLQEIKRQAGYGDWWAFETFPAQAHLVNVTNMRHLWLFPEALPFCWVNADALPPLTDGEGNQPAPDPIATPE
jgi:hypothetical protein